MECPNAVQMHGKHEPCRDTTHLGTDAFLQHLQSLPGYADQACSLSLCRAGCDIDLHTCNTSITSILPCESSELQIFLVIYKEVPTDPLQYTQHKLQHLFNDDLYICNKHTASRARELDLHHYIRDLLESGINVEKLGIGRPL